MIIPFNVTIIDCISLVDDLLKYEKWNNLLISKKVKSTIFHKIIKNTSQKRGDFQKKKTSPQNNKTNTHKE